MRGNSTNSWIWLLQFNGACRAISQYPDIIIEDYKQTNLKVPKLGETLYPSREPPIIIARNIAWLIQIITSLLIVIVLLDVLFGAKYSQLISSYSELTGLVGGTILLIILARQLLHSFNSYKSNLLFIYTIAIFSTVFYFVITASANLSHNSKQTC